MSTPTERIESFLEQNGSANLETLVAMGRTSRRITKYIALNLVYAGKIRSCKLDQGPLASPLYEWIGT